MADEFRRDFLVQSSIPVLRMLNESQAKSFYLDFLGYELDWEHRFRDDQTSPLYMQIHHGHSVLHLNGHADGTSPVSEVRIPVRGLTQFRDFLRARQTDGDSIDISDPRYEGRQTDLNIIDPFGNHLVFWSPGSHED